MSNDGAFVEGESIEQILEQIKALPDGPIRDIDTLKRLILKPYFDKIARHGSSALPTSDSLVSTLIDKFQIPDPNLPLYSNPRLPPENASYKGRWIVCAHWATPQTAKEIETIGGVLGFGDVDTLQTIDAPIELMRYSFGNNTEGFVFLTPLSINDWGIIETPVRIYKPDLRLEQLPKSYVQSVSRHHGKYEVERNGNFLLDKTNILPLGFNVARISRPKA